ncbi:hypothetical protein GCM10022409_39590 [Hymenobacter glaciei]|uniref:Uncharacterized protein n=1 Tax=Hymenobacter glaciei TaxID=877209 RepID=A0ABP7UPH8_9BACT
MCVRIYLGSILPLPQIIWNKSTPGFYVNAVNDEAEAARMHELLSATHVYELGSFMGCSCGLMYNPQLKGDDADNYPSRLKDVALFKSHLKHHLPDNCLKIFATWWEYFPDKYPEETLSLSEFISTEFEIPENIIVTVVT